MVKLTFSTARLLPMGSHPRVADRRTTYDLFGPVSKLWSSNYDRAMVAYLGCLKEFGNFAARRDAEEGAAGGMLAWGTWRLGDVQADAYMACWACGAWLG
jgi:hypothetical protein